MNTPASDFGRWMLERLVVHEGCLTPLARLHNDYAMWSLHNSCAYIRRMAFEALLGGEGVTIEGRLVRGLCLWEDRPPQPEPMAEPLLQKGSITAVQLLEDLLEKGPRSTTQIRATSSQAGFAWPTMLVAKPSSTCVLRLRGYGRCRNE